MPPHNPPLIHAHRLTRRFGSAAGIFDLDLDVAEGHILGLIGPSGSGKTTTVRLLTGLDRPDDGEITVLGMSPVDFDARHRSRIGYLAQESVFYPSLTIAENLDFAASLQGMARSRRRSRISEVLEMVDLTDASDRRLSDASGGMKRRMGLAAALVHEPTVVFLDEPTAALDPILRRRLWDTFGRLRDDGTTLLVTTQYVGEAASCDEIVLLSEGQVAAQGAPEHLRRQAYDGELLRVRFATPPSEAEVRDLSDTLGATRYEGAGIGEIVFTVRNAGTATAELSASAADRGLEVVEAERLFPDFDEVFVRIVDAHRRTVAA